MSYHRRRPGFLDRTALAGVGFTEFSRQSGRSVLALAAEACNRAIEDAGLTREDVNGLVSFSVLDDSVPTQAVATVLGLPNVTYALDMSMGGQAPCFMVMQAAMAVEFGPGRHRRHLSCAQWPKWRAGRVDTIPRPGRAVSLPHRIHGLLAIYRHVGAAIHD